MKLDYPVHGDIDIHIVDYGTQPQSLLRHMQDHERQYFDRMKGRETVERVGGMTSDKGDLSALSSTSGYPQLCPAFRRELLNHSKPSYRPSPDVAQVD